MGRRCSKKAVRCGAIDVVALACTRERFSPASPGAALRRGFLLAPRHPRGRILCCFRRVFPEFALTVMLALPWQIVLHGRQCPASDRAPLPDTNTCGPLRYDQGRSITPACVW